MIKTKKEIHPNKIAAKQWSTQYVHMYYTQIYNKKQTKK